MDTKTTFGISAGFIAAFIVVGSYVSPIILFAALIYCAVKETNAVIKKFTKISLFIWLIQEAVNLLISFIRQCQSLFQSSKMDIDAMERAQNFSNVMGKISTFVDIALLVVIVVFAIIALVQGLPKAAPQVVYAQAPQTTRTCPTCQTLLAGPGICPKCGTNVQ